VNYLPNAKKVLWAADALVCPGVGQNPCGFDVPSYAANARTPKKSPYKSGFAANPLDRGLVLRIFATDF
jgi:hypothetical protein